MDDLKSAIQDSLPEDVIADSSTAEAGNPEALVETTTPKVEQKPPFNEHPDWKKFQERKEREVQESQERANRLERQLFELTNRLTQPKVEDPDEGMSAEERAFFEKMDKRAELRARKVIEEMAPQFRSELKETREVVAALTYEKFLNKYPDVAPGSQEEGQIAQLFQRGYSLDDAYKVVFFDKARQKEVQQVKTNQIQKQQIKQAANLETSGVATGGLPTKTKLSVREFAAQKAKELGLV